MDLKITGRHAKLTPAVREYAEEKLAPVARYDLRTRVLEVVLDHESRSTTVEAKAHVGRGAPLVVRSKHATPEGAIDLVHDKLESALRRNKEKARDGKRVPKSPEPGSLGARPVPAPGARRRGAAAAAAAGAAGGGEEE